MARMDITPRYDFACMQRIQTAMRPPWLIVCFGQQGVRHYKENQACEDNFVVGGCDDAAGTHVTWLVLADGISNCSHSQWGSREACHAVNAYLGREISRGAKPGLDVLTQAMGAAHTTLADLAARMNRSLDEFGTTLAIGLLHGQSIYAATIGDSSAAISMVSEAVTDAPSGDPTRSYAPFCTAKPSGKDNYSYSVTEPTWIDMIARAETHNLDVDLVMLATDGGHNFFLDPTPEGHVFDPAYPEYLLGKLRNPKVGPLLIGNVLSFFMKEVKAEHDDDRTVLIAVRYPEPEEAA
ncbi:protein phosphatase 2C domain-containing protein [Hyphomicrobium sp. B1]|uniref:protein phosphatase 2C domain-containing protein n=1 Tax=unclassified Hyphomicrobium TaxID=2619925 RepID=UPI003918BF7E